jgi:hypothetical protein
MSPKKASGCGCANIPISLILIISGGSYWWFIHLGNINTVIKLLPSNISQLLPNNQQTTAPILKPKPSVSTSIVNPDSRKVQAIPIDISTTKPQASPLPVTAQKSSPFSDSKQPLASSLPLPQTPWNKKAIRGIYLSRYQVTNNADEQTIRSRVRYYHD